MCDVGVRCAAHTKPELNRATIMYNLSKEAFKSAPSKESLVPYKSAEYEWKIARVEHATTETGDTELSAEIAELKAQGKPATEEEGILAQGRAKRQMRVEIRNSIREEAAQKAALNPHQNAASKARAAIKPSTGPMNKSSVECYNKVIKGKKLKMNDHAIKQAKLKGFSPQDIKKTFDSPSKVYPSGSYQGQFRIAGNGICLVGEPEGNDSFRIVTLYEDGTVTAVRPDQLNTSEGRDFAERQSMASANK